LTTKPQMTKRNEETIKITKKETKKILTKISDYHGWEHTCLVAHYSKIVALGEGKNTFNAEMSSLTHDWGRTIEKTDIKKRSHATLSCIISKDFYHRLYEDGRINYPQYNDIQRAVKRHSCINKTSNDTLKILRDSDRLSRFDPLGFYHNTQGILVEEGFPFYIDGQTIIRPADAPVMERKDKKCVIDGLNFCLDFEKIAEIDSAKKIFKKLRNTYRSFLELFSRHTDLTDDKLWVAFLKKHADEFRKKKENFEKSFIWDETKKDFEKWLKFYEENVGPEIYSEEKFQDFLNEYQK